MVAVSSPDSLSFLFFLFFHNSHTPISHENTVKYNWVRINHSNRHLNRATYCTTLSMQIARDAHFIILRNNNAKKVYNHIKIFENSNSHTQYDATNKTENNG